MYVFFLSVILKNLLKKSVLPFQLLPNILDKILIKYKYPVKKIILHIQNMPNPVLLLIIK